MEKESSFYLDITTRIITEIKIINTKLVNKNEFLSSEYILYTFKVITPFNSWFIKKRYSEIKILHDYLVSSNKKLVFPAFPPKRFFSTKESTIIERKNGFEEMFSFILNNFEILNNTTLIDFLHIKKNILIIYIKNCILINENKYKYELIDIVNNSSSSSNLSQNSDESQKKSKKEKKNKKVKEEGKNDNDLNIINEIYEKKDKKEKKEKKNHQKNISCNGNYFRCYEDFKLNLEKAHQRSQVSFSIIKEFLRNLKVHSSHISEIISDFTDYMKYKNKWKKFNNYEINALFLGIKKEDLLEDYYQYILNERKSIFNKNSSEISDKTTLSNTPSSISINNNINTNIINTINNNMENKSNKFSKQQQQLISNIGKFEENNLGARSCLLLLNKFFERQFNPEVDNYITIFRKIDIIYIQSMNLCEFYQFNNNANLKICFDVLNIYLGRYEKKKQIKILKELNANDTMIEDFLVYLEYHEDKDNMFNLYNIE